MSASTCLFIPLSGRKESESAEARAGAAQGKHKVKYKGESNLPHWFAACTCMFEM